MRRIGYFRQGLWMLGFLLLIHPSLHAATAVLSCPHSNPTGPVLSGIEELERVLSRQGWEIQRSFGNNAGIAPLSELQIVVASFSSFYNTPAEAEKFRDVVPNEPESFAILKSFEQGGVKITALGSDSIGAMYAAYEVAEQVDRNTGTAIAERIAERKLSPSIAHRGIQLLIHKQALEDPYSWFHSEAFWQGYLDTMSRNRFNCLELQGIYDLISTQFGNGLPYFVSGSELNPQDIERNSQSLRRVIALAHKYGILVYFINSGLEWGRDAEKNKDRAYVEPLLLNALTRLLHECSGLDGIGFMVDDSIFPAEFYQNTYMQAIAQDPLKPVLVMHTWGANSKEIQRLAESHSQRTILEMKFNGDHLGAPYPVSGGRICDWSSYSYLDYFHSPHRYDLLFQIGFNGTHRVFPWGDFASIRRTVSSIHFAGSIGFVLQTFSTFFPHADAYTNPIRSDLRYYDWTYERDWYWFLLWGRMAYDVQTSDSFFQVKFQDHFGMEAGGLLYQALQKASQVIPAIAQTAFRGPGIRHFAPELEPPQRLEDVMQMQPLDSFSVRSVTEEIQSLVSGKPDGRSSPLDILQKAASSAIESVTLAQQAGAILSKSKESGKSTPGDSVNPTSVNLLQEWNSWLIDFQALAALGKYWRDEFSSAIQLGLYKETGDIPSLVIASERLDSASEAWQEVQEQTGIHYRPLLDTLRNQQTRFHWKSLPTYFDEDRLLIVQLYNAWLEQTEWPSVSGHFPLTKASTQAPALLTLSIPPKIPVESLFVQYQNRRGEIARFPMAKTQLEGVYYTDIVQSVLKEGIFQYFFLGNRTDVNEAWVIPNNGTPYSIMVTDDREPPVFSDLAEERQSKQVSVTVTLTDASGIDTATLWWKSLPSNLPWQKSALDGSGSQFQGSFPLTNEGALYLIEAVDRAGNISRSPDIQTDTPYLVIPPSAQ